MLEVGAVLGGRYTLKRRLGGGGFGVVYLAEDRSLTRQVAVKVLHGPEFDDPANREKLTREARTLARLRSPHVVHVYEVGDDPQAGPFLVMEYLEGTTLEDHLREVGGRLSPAGVWDIFDQLQQGLSEAHQSGVVHRDLKPTNVFLAKAGKGKGKGKAVVKLIDFGLAKDLEGGKSVSASRVVGTPTYMAPEQIDAEHLGPETDVWALGLMAFWMLTGKHYWRTLNQGAAPPLSKLIVEITTNEIESASVRAASLGASGLLPMGFDAWFASCVVRERSQRFADAATCIEALDRVLVRAAAGGSEVSSGPADPPPASGGWTPRMDTAENPESFELPKQKAAPPPPVLPIEPAPGASVASAEPADPPAASARWSPRMETAEGFVSFTMPKEEAAPPPPVVPTEAAPPPVLPKASLRSSPVPPSATRTAPARSSAPTLQPQAKSEPAPRVRRTGWAVPGVLGVGVLLGLGVRAFRSSPTPARPPAPAPAAAAVEAMLSCSEGMLPVEGRSSEGVVYRFCMDRTEVTVAAYRACPRSTCTEPHTGEYCNWNGHGRDHHPVNCVDALQADAFCAWRRCRLPTEQQWHFAAQGPDGRTFPWGQAEPSDQLCWNRLLSGAGTCVVGAYPAGRSFFGLDDMSGNVWEWTIVSESSEYAAHGGGWASDDSYSVRADSRYRVRVRADSLNRGAWSPYPYHVGFRCACSAQ